MDTNYKIKKIQNSKLIQIILLFCIFFAPLSIFAEYKEQIQQSSVTPYIQGEVIVKFKNSALNLNQTIKSGNINSAELKVQNLSAATQSLSNKENLEIKEVLGPGNLGLFKIKSNQSVEEFVNILKKNPEVEYAEPNYIYKSATINTNDTYKDLLWGLENFGQQVNEVLGLNDADIDAPEAWVINEGINDSVIVAVVDVGVAYNHPDLVNNMWDGSLCKDENGIYMGDCLHGYNYANNTKIPLPDGNSHGTHISGTIAATKNNGMGIIGVSPNAKIMALNTNEFTVFNLVKSIDFARENGAKIINASYGGESYDVQSEFEAIERFTNSGGLFVAAAHNQSRDNDSVPVYPASDNIDSIISVAATNQNDNLASFSNWGIHSVDIAAPGVNIYSTYCVSDCSSQSYNYMNGTSMAVPHVAGLAALIWGTNPELTNIGVKNIILSKGDSIPSLSTKLLTGKRINAYNSLDILDSLYSYTPNAGYLEDAIIPASQINYNNDTGLISINFKVKDTFSKLTMELSDFSYSTNNGVTWQTPINSDNSTALSANWNKNNYISEVDYSGDTYSFDFYSKNNEAININNTSSDNVKFRFKVTDGINTSDYITSEAIIVDNFSFDLNIYQPTGPISINSNSYEIIGSTNAGSTIEIYRDGILVNSLQLEEDEADFIIQSDLILNSENIFTIKAISNGLEQIVILPTIIQNQNYFYSPNWTAKENSNQVLWESVASSDDGNKLVALARNDYIYTSKNRGFSWIERTGAGRRAWKSIASSSNGEKLVAVVGDNYTNGYIYTSTDSGLTWTERTSGGARKWIYVASSGDGDKLIAVDRNGYIYTSTNAGVTWLQRIITGSHNWSTVASSSLGEKLIVAGGLNTNGYIYTSVDSGLTWTERTNAGSRKWSSVASSADGNNLVATVNGGYIYTSTDGGENWSERVAIGSPANWWSVASSNDGNKLVALTGGDSSPGVGYLYISNNGGNNWLIQNSAGLHPWHSVASSSSGNKLVAAAYNTNISSYDSDTVPFLSTDDSNQVSLNSATLNGEINYIGSEKPTSRGFEYGSTTSYGITTTENGSFGTGTFLADISSLVPCTTYHYRAYAINNMGVGFGNDMTFTTESINTPPTTTSVTISGSEYVGNTLTGSYIYADDESDEEGTSTYRWLRDNVAIGGQTSITHTTTNDDLNKIIKFEVTPIALTGELTGAPIVSSGLLIKKRSSGGGGGGGGGGRSTPTNIPPASVICQAGQIFNPDTGKKCTSYLEIINFINPSIPTNFIVPTNFVNPTSIARTLKQGMNGEDVKILQKYLNSHGYIVSLSGAGSVNNEITYFGLKTKNAVISFQKYHKLTPDGVVGLKTREKMK